MRWETLSNMIDKQNWYGINTYELFMLSLVSLFVLNILSKTLCNERLDRESKRIVMSGDERAKE